MIDAAVKLLTFISDLVTSIFPGPQFPENPPSVTDLADLAAQQSMASAAWVMVWLTLASVVVGTIGIIVVLRTLQASEAATEAANEAVRVSREVGEAQTMAYLQVHDLGVKLTRPLLFKHGPVPALSFMVRNSGNSPAIEFEWNAVVAYQYRHSMGDPRGPNETRDHLWKPSIPANSTERVEHADKIWVLLTEDYEAFESEQLWMSVTIRSTFVDVFGKSRRSEDSFEGWLAKSALTESVTLGRTRKPAEDAEKAMAEWEQAEIEAREEDEAPRGDGETV